MPPFADDVELESFPSLDLDLGSKSYASNKPSFFEQVRQMYMLAVVDEATGTPMRPATEEELNGIPLELVQPLPSPKPKAEPKPETPKESTKHMSLQELLAAARNGNGPMCDHCGATGGSKGCMGHLKGMDR